MQFDGDTYDEERDSVRLTGQWQRVYGLMQDGRWRTLRRICDVVGKSEAGVSARLRDLRKERFGSFRVEKRRVKGGLYEYRVLPPEPSDQMDMLEAAE